MVGGRWCVAGPRGFGNAHALIHIVYVFRPPRVTMVERVPQPYIAHQFPLSTRASRRPWVALVAPEGDTSLRSTVPAVERVGARGTVKGASEGHTKPSRMSKQTNPARERCGAREMSQGSEAGEGRRDGGSEPLPGARPKGAPKAPSSHAVLRQRPASKRAPMISANPCRDPLICRAHRCL